MRSEAIYEDLADYLYLKLNFPTGSHYGFDKKLWGFWCDGLYWPPYFPEYSRTLINDEGFIELKMDFGQAPQLDDYTLILFFGQDALHRNAIGSDLRECVPDFAEEPELITIDTENKIVEIHLK